MTLTMELPETLLNQFRERQIPEKEIEAIVVAALELWLAQPQEPTEERFGNSAVTFTRRLVAQNRELFETLAKR